MIASVAAASIAPQAAALGTTNVDADELGTGPEGAAADEPVVGPADAAANDGLAVLPAPGGATEAELCG